MTELYISVMYARYDAERLGAIRARSLWEHWAKSTPSVKLPMSFIKQMRLYYRLVMTFIQEAEA